MRVAIRHSDASRSLLDGGILKTVYVHVYDAWGPYPEIIRALIRGTGAIRIAEVGAGANPTLPSDFIQAEGLDVTLIDISEAELTKAPAGYRKVVADAGSLDFPLEDQFDFVFTNMLAEHVPDARQFHINVHRMLVSGGVAFHYFPTLFSLPMVVNRIFSEGLGYRILEVLMPGRRSKEGSHGKFPAYYRWCFGPMAFQERRFMDLGFKVIEYRGTFGYHGYFERYPRLLALHEWLTRLSLKFPVPLFTSGAQVLLSKGEAAIACIPAPEGTHGKP